MRYSFFIRIFFTSLLNLVVIFAGTFVFLKFFLINSVYDEIKKQDGEILFQIQRHMDSNLAAMRRIAHSMTIDPGFTPFNLPDNPGKAMSAIKTLKNHALISANVSLLGISYAHSDYAVSDKGSFTKEFFAQFPLPPFGELADPENLAREFIIKGDLITFVFPYPNQSSLLGVIFIQYPRDAFYSEFVKTFLDQQRFVSIRNETRGALLFTNLDIPPEDLAVTSYLSPATGYSYEIATPRSYYAAILNKFQLRLITVIAALFCAGFTLNLLVARFNARPLRNLLGKFGLPEGRGDFYAIETFLSEQQSARRRTARDGVLLKLMEGGFGSMTELKGEGKKAGLDFSGPCFAFVIVHDPDPAGTPPDHIHGIGGTAALFYRQFEKSGETDIWVYSGEGPALTGDLILDFRAAAYGENRLTVAAGPVSDNTALAAQCFLEALSALNHRLVRGKGSVILFQDLPKADLIDSEELNALLGDFNRALGESRWDEARAAAEPVFAFCRRYSLSAARYILGRLLYRLNELHLIHGVPVHGMAEFDTTDRLIDFAKDLLAAAVRPLQGMARSADADLAGRIKNHLETNFDNKMLSLETIAETFGFSVGHLSRIFREQTGMTPASYIQDLRIREACRLLRFSGMPVKNIVARIGYMDHSSFSRSFKSRMGISPQEYRNSPRPAKE